VLSENRFCRNQERLLKLTNNVGSTAHEFNGKCGLELREGTFSDGLADSWSKPNIVAQVRRQFGITNLVFVGDCGMITSKRMCSCACWRITSNGTCVMRCVNCSWMMKTLPGRGSGDAEVGVGSSQTVEVGEAKRRDTPNFGRPSGAELPGSAEGHGDAGSQQHPLRIKRIRVPSTDRIDNSATPRLRTACNSCVARHRIFFSGTDDAFSLKNTDSRCGNLFQWRFKFGLTGAPDENSPTGKMPASGGHEKTRMVAECTNGSESDQDPEVVESSGPKTQLSFMFFGE